MRLDEKIDKLQKETIEYFYAFKVGHALGKLEGYSEAMKDYQKWVVEKKKERSD